MSSSGFSSRGGSISSSSSSSQFPFTPSQWQELEHQALIYKHMVAGVPIPHDLLLAVKRSLDSSPHSSSSFLPSFHTSPLGWNPYQMGYGKKIDPEPGRCRRTDGKKWRCSKEAYPDSKYCERHMHRGKNRSRKPVEVITSVAAATASTEASAAAAIGRNPTAASISSLPPMAPSSETSSYATHQHHHQQLMYHPHSSSSRPPGFSLSSQGGTSAHLLLDSGSLRDPRYVQGVVKEDLGGHVLFNGNTSGTRRGYSSAAASSSIDEPWATTPAGATTTSLLNQQRQGSHSTSSQSGYNVWGSRDFDCELTMRVERENAPHKITRDSWNDSSSSTTQLSISMPTSTHHDFFLSNTRTP